MITKSYIGHEVIENIRPYGDGDVILDMNNRIISRESLTPTRTGSVQSIFQDSVVATKITTGMPADGHWSYFSGRHGLAVGVDDYLFSYVEATGGATVIAHRSGTTTTAFDAFVPGGGHEDDHNAAAFIVTPLGMVLAAYSAHAIDNELRWRLSTSANPSAPAGGDWGGEQTLNVGSQHSYANLFTCNDGTSDRVYCLSRGGSNGKKWYIRKYTEGTNTFAEELWVFDGPWEDGDNGYPRVIAEGSKAWIWTNDHEIDQQVSNWCFYIDFATDEYCRPDGTVIKSTSDAPLHHYEADGTCEVYTPRMVNPNPGAGYDAGLVNGRAWTMSIGLKNGLPVCLASVQNFDDGNRTDAMRIYYYEYRFDGTSWTSKMIANTGNGKSERSPRYVYGADYDPDDPDVIYISSIEHNPFATDRLTSGRLAPRAELFRGHWGSEGHSWEPFTTGSTAGPASQTLGAGVMMPIVIKGGTTGRVLALEGTYDWWKNGLWTTSIVEMEIT